MAQGKVETICDAPLECGEGPMWDVAKQKLYWTNAYAPAIWEYDRATEKAHQIGSKRQAGSIVLHADGGFILSTSDGFFHWKSDEDMRVVADTCDGKPATMINDISADSRGRIFGGQECYKEGEPFESGYLYRLDTDGTVTIVDDGMHVANGIGFSLDESTMYMPDSVKRVVYAYDYSVESGQVSKRRDFIKLPPEAGLPDGLTVDSEGFIWVARWFGGGISRFDPDGKLERTIDFPVGQTSSVMFGGKDLNEIYVTSASVLWESKLAPPGHDYSPPRGGPTFRLIQDIQGRPENLARV